MEESPLRRAITPAALRRHVLDLCAIGNRYVGSPGEQAARHHIRSELGRAGAAEVRVEELEVMSYTPESAVCTIAGVADGELPAVGLQFTASREVEAEAVYLGSPRTIDEIRALENEGVTIAGKAAVVDTYWPYGVVPYLVEAGAATVVTISPNAVGMTAHFTAQLYPPGEGTPTDRTPLPIPGVTIDRGAAARLLALMSHRSRTLKVSHSATYAPVTTANVIAEVPGTELPEERVVVGAHYDTQLQGVGACDNGTGVAALIELARFCAEHPRKRTLTFVAFADEEHGFQGAVDWCRRHQAKLDQTLGMVCLDALAWVYPGRRALHADPSFQDYAAARAREEGWDAQEIVDASLLLGSDHNPFIDAGVPAVWFWHYPPQHLGYHSADDIPELVDFEGVAATAVAAGHTAFSLANEPVSPLGRSRATKRWYDLRPGAAEVAG